MERTALEPLDISDINCIEDWFERFAFYVVTNDKIDDPKKEIAYLVTFMGKDAYKLLKELCYPKKPSDLTTKDIKDCLLKHLRPKNYEVHERAVFNSLVRKPNQSVPDFILTLQKQAMKCNFGAELSEHLRDRLVAGINDDHIKRKFLCEASLTFDTARSIAIAHVSIESAIKSEHEENPVLAILQKKSYSHPHKQNAKSNRPTPKAHFKPKQQNFSNSDFPKGVCYSCGGRNHFRQNCKYRNATCRTCNRIGHVMAACRSGKSRSGFTNFVDNESKPSSDDYCLSISSGNHIKRPCKVSDSTRSRTIEFIYDTGSPHSFIASDQVQTFDVQVVPTSTTVKGITGHKFAIQGEVQLQVNGVQARFLVCDSLNILGLREIMKLHPDVEESLLHGLVDENSTRYISDLVEQVSNCSGGINIKPIHIDHDNRDPKFFKSRPIPFGLREPVKKILDKWVTDGIAVKVQSSRWATPIVTPLKANGQPRVCGDYRITINPILRHHAPTTLEPEDIFAHLADASFFTKIDLENAFLQIPLDQASQELTTLITPFGLYSMKFLPFGWHVSSAVFQSVIDTIIKGLPNVVAYQDDLLIFAKTEREHNEYLTQLLERLKKFNVRINKRKSIFQVNRINYLGYLITAEGIQPDPTKFLPIMSADDPQDQQQLHSILGCLQYYSRFSKNFAKMAAGLFDLCRKGCEFVWTNEHADALKQLKHEIFNKKLKPFSMVADNTRLICDASERAIGGMLEQNGSPVICISRKLSPSERGYAQTQKEALAIHWCVKRLHKFLYGLRFTIVTDHRSLMHIFNPQGSISKGTSNMLQRWSWRLSSYNYDIEFQNGKCIPQADFLSRYAKMDNDCVSSSSSTLFVQPLPIDSSVLVSESKRYFGPVLRAIKYGWSARARRQFRNLYVIRDELSTTIEGRLAYREMTIIPPCLRGRMLEHLHVGHIGTEKMRSLARLLCWWPTINADIANFARQCKKCTTKVRNTPSDWSAWPATYEVNQRLHIDYAGPFLNKYYCLVLIDSYSKWPEVYLTKNANAAFTERCLRSYFSREGVPQTIVSDNGSHFTEVKLNDWLSTLNVIHLYSAPRHPKSNGLAENFIKTLKQAISAEIKTFSEGCDLERFILNFLFQYRNAEHSTTRQRPSVLFRGHALRSNIIGQQKVMFQRGNDLRYCQGVILRKLGRKMASVMDVEDGTIHRRHVEQLRFGNGAPSMPTTDPPTTVTSTPLQLNTTADPVPIPIPSSSPIPVPLSAAVPEPDTHTDTVPGASPESLPNTVPNVVPIPECATDHSASQIPNSSNTSPVGNSVSRYGRVRRKPNRLDL